MPLAGLFHPDGAVFDDALALQMVQLAFGVGAAGKGAQQYLVPGAGGGVAALYLGAGALHGEAQLHGFGLLCAAEGTALHQITAVGRCAGGAGG